MLFPNEKWESVEERIYLSPRRAVGKKSNYKNELRNAQILRDHGCIIYFAPESRRHDGKQFDAIVNGLAFEFKNVGGNANTLITQFLKSRAQAPNVFINLETSDLTSHEIMSALYGARGSNRYVAGSGGWVILKTRDTDSLICLEADSLKAPG